MRTPVRLLVLAAVLVLATACSGDEDPSSLPFPTAASTDTAYESDTHEVRRSEVSIRYAYTGRTVRSEAVPVDVPGQLRFVGSVPDGRSVNRGDRIGELRIAPGVEADLERRARTSTVAASTLATLRTKSGPVRAPVAGVFIETGGPRVVTAGIDAAVDLNPLQVLRTTLVSFKGRAQVETVYGFRATPCHGIWVEAGDAGSVMHCRLPAGTETTEGLPARLTLRTPTTRGIAVPADYVGYDRRTDSYVVVKRQTDGTVKRPVVTGTTDGVRRVILSGVREGAVLDKPSRRLAGRP